VRLTVVGSSPAWPNPGSAQSGYLVEHPGKLLLDCGPGVLARLREGGEPDVEAIAITHFHLDHWGDLVPWAWLSVYGQTKLEPPELWLPPGGIGVLEQFATLWGNVGMFARSFDLREYGENEPFETSGFSVEARRVLHYAVDAFAFRVSADGRTLVYSGDAGPTDALTEAARGADLFVCEATLGSEHEEVDPRGHLTAEEALASADGPVLLTHRPVELPPPDGAPLARDGLVLEV
jgi:ribonuclease BN (tRNA processing enzyme)